MEELRARFEANVEQGEPDACWPWTGTIRRKGYGQLSHQRRAILAHRLAWELAHGPIPEGLQVCHRCDNPPCCNPAHLFLGTAADNQRDKRQKGRAARGEANGGGRKLTEADVVAMREELAAGATLTDLSGRFGVSLPMVAAIRDRRKWSHVA